MARLTADPRNIVFVHSGRSSAVLEQWFAGADRLGLSAEDGYYIRFPGAKEWSPLDAKLDLGWREVLKPVFEYFAERTPGSFIEEKELALTWHYRNADVDFGARCQRRYLAPPLTFRHRSSAGERAYGALEQLLCPSADCHRGAPDA